MPIQEIMKLRTSQDEEVRIALLLAIHCAPILSGSKAANIMTVTVHESVARHRDSVSVFEDKRG